MRCDAQGTNPGRNGDGSNLTVAQVLAEGCGMKRLESEHLSSTSDQQGGGRLHTWGSQGLRALLFTVGEKLSVHTWLGWTVDIPLLGISFGGSWKSL